MNRPFLFLIAFVIVAVGFASSARAQDRPIFGELSEIKGKTKVYVEAGSGDRGVITKSLEKNGFSVVSDADAAQFFILFEVSESSKSVGYMNLATGEMKVYLQTAKQKRIVWSKEETNGAFGSAVAKSLIKKFLKDLAKIR